MNTSTNGLKHKLNKTDLTSLIAFVRLNEKYESKGKLNRAIALCEFTLNNLRNRAIDDSTRFFQVAVVNKLKQLKLDSGICESIEQESKDQRNIVKTTLQFISKITGLNEQAKKISFDYIKSLCNQKLKSIDDNLNRTRILDCLACALATEGEYTNAIQLVDEAIDLRDRFYGSDHAEMLVSLSIKSYVYYRLKDYNQSAGLISKSLDLKKRILDKNHNLILIELNNLELIQNLLDGRVNPVKNRSSIKEKTFYLTLLNDFY